MKCQKYGSIQNPDIKYIEKWTYNLIYDCKIKTTMNTKEILETIKNYVEEFSMK